MFRKITSALSSLSVSPVPTLGNEHSDPARITTYTSIAAELKATGVPVPDDCSTCEAPCDANETRSYPDYVMEKYGDLGELPSGFDTDWETRLAGSAAGGRGRVVVISTGKSDWERDHTDEKESLPHKLDQHIRSLDLPAPPLGTKDFAKHPVPEDYIFPSTPSEYPPALYSSSLITQSDDPEDQTVLVFPDWKVVQEVENSAGGAAALYSANLSGGSSPRGESRQRSWILPYRAVILLCSHKRRDKRCHIAAPLLRSALHVVLAKHNISIDETGASLAHLDSPALEDTDESLMARDTEMAKRIAGIEGIEGGEGGEVGIFNINHLGGHRYAGVMLILFPSGAYLSYGRVTPSEIPRVVEETIVRGKVIPGLLRNAAGVTRRGNSILGW